MSTNKNPPNRNFRRFLNRLFNSASPTDRESRPQPLNS